jgi:archaellum biogenesis ATPase FlaH
LSSNKINIDYDKLLNSRHFKHDYAPPGEQVFFKIRDKVIGSAGNFCVFSGLPKAGKSTFINAAISSMMLTEKQKFDIRLETDPIRPFLGYFDTESAEYDFYKNLQRIKDMACREKLIYNFNAFNTRQDVAEVNRILVETYIKNYPASVIIIDGFLDLINNYNDETESRMIINWLKKITAEYSVLIIGVIHTGKKDNHTLGHFGSMVDRYAQSVLEVVKDRENNVYSLSAKYLRSAADFDPVYIQWDGNKYVQCSSPPPTKESAPSRSQRR